MLAALLIGISYGFAAGISPGPTLALTIAQTIQRGWRAGSMVALAPLLTDAPIILLALFLLRLLPLNTLGWMEVLGGVFVIYLGAETVRAVLVHRMTQPNGRASRRDQRFAHTAPPRVRASHADQPAQSASLSVLEHRRWPGPGAKRRAGRHRRGDQFSYWLL